MSISPLAAGDQQPQISGAGLLVVVLMTAGGVGAALLLRVFRRRSIIGPARIPGDAPVWPMMLVTIIGGGTWLLCQVLYGAAAAVAFHRTHPDQPFGTDQLNVDDFAFLSIVPAAVALAILLIGDVAANRETLRWLGFTLRRIGPGLIRGIVAIVIVLPIMFWSSALLELLYRVAHIEHPNQHELLRAMKDADRWTRDLLIIGACIAAPVFEEHLFRGHIQTILVRLFNESRSLPPFAQAVGAPGVGASAAADLPLPVEYAGKLTPLHEVAPRPRRLVWLAVLITSVLFAVVHPPWMMPLIFVLSLCLGYAYERTGNLWVSIFMHALFNTVSTLTFLNLY